MTNYRNSTPRELIRKLDTATKNFEAAQVDYVQGRIGFGALNKLALKVGEIRDEIERRAETN